MKISFNNFRTILPNYVKMVNQPKQTFNKNSISFQSDVFTKQENRMNTLKDTYEALSRKLDSKQKNNASWDGRSMMAQIIDLNEQYVALNEILNNATVENFENDEKVLVNYLLTMQRLGKQQGFNRIIGYDNIKQTLMDDFILKTMAKARTSQETDVPNAFLFFGPTGCGKTTFAHALAEQTLSYVEEIDAAKLTPEEAMKQIKDKAKNAKHNFQNSEDKKRTIIVINEFDSISNKYSSVVDELCDFIKNCADEYKCTLFLTTNNPLDIDERILNKNITPQKIALEPADVTTARKIIEEKLSQMGEPTKVASDITKFLFMDPERLYSNGDIVNILNATLKLYEKPTAQNYIQVAKKDIPPSVSKKSYSKFKKEKQELGI